MLSWKQGATGTPPDRGRRSQQGSCCRSGHVTIPHANVAPAAVGNMIPSLIAPEFHCSQLSKWASPMDTDSSQATATGVGPAPEDLPPEIWFHVIAYLDDDIAWHRLRRVSPYLRQVTEEAFASLVLRTCSLRFAGESARELL